MDYKDLADTLSRLESTTKRLKKTHIVSELLKKTGERDIEPVILMLQGRLFPEHDEREIGVASRLVIKAISNSTGYTSDQIETRWKKTGDLGLVAEELSKRKTQNTLFSEELRVKQVFESIRKLSDVQGAGSVEQKTKMIANLISSASPIEAKFIVRTALQDLRVGVAEGTLRDAIAWAYLGVEPNYDEKKESINPDDREEYNCKMELLQRALDRITDYAEVAKVAMKGLAELEKIRMSPGKPLKVMLAQKAKTIAEAFEIVGKPAALEYKYDGFRMQVHKEGEKVSIFTRRLEEVTEQFPEVAECVLKSVKADECILDCEAVGYDSKTGKYTPFQHISQRIKRKYDIGKIAKELPVELNVFDIISFEGKEQIQEPFKNRRELIGKIVKEKEKSIVLAKQIITEKEAEAKKFFDESVKKGNEGLMFKSLDAPYKPGSRVGYMIKYKSAMDELDVVIVGAEWGEGKRSGWLTSFIIACRSESGFLEMGRVGTGLKEKSEEGLSFDDLTKMLKPLIKDDKGKIVSVKPKIVITVQFEEIQKSSEYSSGYALRFPRVTALREDRGPDEAASLEEVEDAYYGQRKK